MDAAVVCIGSVAVRNTARSLTTHGGSPMTRFLMRSVLALAAWGLLATVSPSFARAQTYDCPTVLVSYPPQGTTTYSAPPPVVTYSAPVPTVTYAAPAP